MHICFDSRLVRLELVKRGLTSLAVHNVRCIGRLAPQCTKSHPPPSVAVTPLAALVQLATVEVGEIAGRSPESHDAPPSRGRRVAFAVVTGLVGLLFFTNVKEAGAPWFEQAANGFAHSGISRWHAAMEGSVDAIFVGAALLALVWRPLTKPLLLQNVIAIFLITDLVLLPFRELFLIVFTVPIIIVAALYPWPRTLFQLPRLSISWAFLALVVVAAALLAPVIWHSFSLNMQPAERQNQWITDVEHILVLIISGVAVSTLRPGWPWLGMFIAVAYLYLGVAALTIPNQPGSWGVGGGALALVGGLGYLAATVWELRRRAGPIRSPS
jgi:hypothetical protein